VNGHRPRHRPTPDDTKLRIITDAEMDDNHIRQATALLLPDEY